jgi:threonine aldolase
LYSFRNDYSEGAHPRILQALIRSNLEQTSGYGLDHYCQDAANLIREHCACPTADVHFVVGGTQANLLVIHAMLRSFEAVIAANTAHVNVHETGAIEATGHKVCAVSSPDGKLTPALVESVVQEHSTEHMVHPRLVYLSDSTEIGTIYSKAELQALRLCCQKHHLLMYLDGARLGCALTAPGNDLTLSDLAALTDAFTIGGTKNGALFGEAILLLNRDEQMDFRCHIKQRGAMLAKGRLLGIQYIELLRDGLYFELARHANEMAAMLRGGILDHGYSFPVDSPSNQLFPALPDSVIQDLQKKYDFDIERPVGQGNTLIRLVTSWTTQKEMVQQFLDDLPYSTIHTNTK